MSTSGKGKGDQTETQTPNYGNKRGVRRGHGSEPPRPALTRPAAAAPEPLNPCGTLARTHTPPALSQRLSLPTPLSLWCPLHLRKGKARSRQFPAPSTRGSPAGWGGAPLCVFSGTLVPRVLRWWPRVCPLGRLVDPSLCVLVSTRKAPFVSYLYIVFYLKKRILWLKKNNLKTANG